MTEYVILRATNESGTIFGVTAEQAASSAEAAVRAFVKSTELAQDAEEFYAAVPKSSWKVFAIATAVVETVKVKSL